MHFISEYSCTTYLILHKKIAKLHKGVKYITIYDTASILCGHTCGRTSGGKGVGDSTSSMRGSSLVSVTAWCSTGGGGGRSWTMTGEPWSAASEQSPEPILAAEWRSTEAAGWALVVFFLFGSCQVFSLPLLCFVILK
jgi:hypothetical protein